MKVIRIVSFLDFGGVEQVLFNSVPYLMESSKMEILIIVLGTGGRVEKELVKKGVTIVVFNHNPKIPNFNTLWKLFVFIKKFKPDVVHCQGSEANFHGLIAARIAGVSVRVGEEIGLPNHHSYWKYIFKYVYKNATKVIAISHAVKDRILDLEEVEEEKIEVVYNPIKLGDGQKGRIDEIGIKKAFVFVTTCRLVEVKNLERLINCFAQLCQKYSERSILLWIVGDGPLRVKLENHSRSLEISNSIRFWGFQLNVFPILEKSNVFVLPSLSEGSSVSLVEAMSIGLPSIITSEGGACEIVEGSNSYIIVNPLSEKSIFSALESFLLTAEIEMADKGSRAREKAHTFSNQNYLKGISKVYGLF